MGYHLPLNKIDKVDFSSTIIKKNTFFNFNQYLGDCALQGILGKYCEIPMSNLYATTSAEYLLCIAPCKIGLRTLKFLHILQDIITLFSIIIGIEIGSLFVILV